MHVKLCDVLDLKSISIKIKNIENVERKINKIIDAGINDLQMVVDFDETLTKQKLKSGKSIISSGELFARLPSIPIERRNGIIATFHSYRSKEIDPNISVDEKIRIMDENYGLLNKIILGVKMPMDELNDYAKIIAENFRDGVDDLLNTLNNHEIPITLFSAGFGDAIEQSLNHRKIYLPNIKIASNFLDLDEGGYVISLNNKGKLIHSYNKSETSMWGTDIYNVIKSRNNVILAGDSLGDVTMCDGMDNIDTVLRIGFIVDNLEENLPFFMEAYDIVLVDDQTADVLNNILNCIISKSKSI